MWRATVLAAGLAVALGGAVDEAAAQGKGKGKGQASERFERKEEVDRGAARTGSRAPTGRTARAVTQDDRDWYPSRRGSDDGDWYPSRRDDDRDSDGRYDRDGRYDDRRYDDRYTYGKKNGPKFCSNGQGHPVHGRQWCAQKGYGLGNDRWRNAGWEDIVFGRRDRRYDYENGRMSGSVLQDVLGRVIYGRLASQSRYVGGGSLNGQWLSQSGGPRILQVFAGSRPLAELVDGNRDGRAEVVMLNFGR
jgi:hypothetical protein